MCRPDSVQKNTRPIPTLDFNRNSNSPLPIERVWGTQGGSPAVAWVTVLRNPGSLKATGPPLSRISADFRGHACYAGRGTWVTEYRNPGHRRCSAVNRAPLPRTTKLNCRAGWPGLSVLTKPRTLPSDNRSVSSDNRLCGFRGFVSTLSPGHPTGARQTAGKARSGRRCHIAGSGSASPPVSAKKSPWCVPQAAENLSCVRQCYTYRGKTRACAT